MEPVSWIERWDERIRLTSLRVSAGGACRSSCFFHPPSFFLRGKTSLVIAAGKGLGSADTKVESLAEMIQQRGLVSVNGTA